MHGYFWDRKYLERKLTEFNKGQFLMETKEGLIFRGEIKECVIPSKKNRRVLISFEWLSERRLFLDAWWKPKPRWVLLEPPRGVPFLDVGFTSYYTQQDEERIKMWGTFGEVCKFFRKDDHTNLVRNGNEIVPHWELHRLDFFRAIIIATKK